LSKGLKVAELVLGLLALHSSYQFWHRQFNLYRPDSSISGLL